MGKAMGKGWWWGDLLLASVGCGVGEAFMEEEANRKARQLYLFFFPLSATTQRTMDLISHTSVPVLWTLQGGPCGGSRPSSGPVFSAQTG